MTPNMSMKRLQGTIFWLLVGALPMAGCNREEPLAPPSAPIVVVVPVEARTLSVEIQASGELRAALRAGISAEVAGQVTELVLDEGDTAAADEVVMLIDPERRELEVASAQAAVAEAGSSRREAIREHRRLLELQKRGAASSSQLESAASALEAVTSRLGAAQANLGMARRSLRDSQVSAPFAGVIAERRVNRGEFVSPGTPLFELVSSDPLEVEFHLSEADSNRVAIGNSVVLTVDAHPQERFSASVTFVSPVIDERMRTLRVKAELANPDGRLRPGSFAHIDLGVATRENVAMIPEESVLQRASGPIVFVIGEDDRVARREVSTGEYRAGDVEIISGLEPGDFVVSQGHFRLVDDMQVRPQHVDGAPYGSRIADAGLEAEANL